MHHQLTHLANLCEKQFLEAFVQISNECTSLNLSKNDLGKRGGTFLARIKFPPKLISLDLNHNGLIKKSGYRLAQFFLVLPLLTFLNLRGNSLARKSPLQWSLQFDFSVPATNFKSGNELAIAFTALPKTLSHLDLRENDLNILPLEEMSLLKGKLPQISTIHLSYEEMNAMTKEQRQAIRDIFPNAKSIIVCKENMDKSVLAANVEAGNELFYDAENAKIDNEELYTEENPAYHISLLNNYPYSSIYS